MHVPDHYLVTDPEIAADIVARARLGTLVTHGPQGLFATHLPMLHDRDRGVLLGHVARANPHPDVSGKDEALVIFRATDGYVSPSYYPSKAEHGRQVPTWNYEAAHVYGRLEWFDDRSRLLDMLGRLTALHEAARPKPWSIADAPEYVERLLRGIVGVEIAVTRVLAKRKLSQNKDARDRAGAVAGLSASDDPRDRATAEVMSPAARADA